MVVSSAMRIGTQEIMFRTGMVHPVAASGRSARPRRKTAGRPKRRAGPEARRPSRTAEAGPKASAATDGDVGGQGRRCRPARAARTANGRTGEERTAKPAPRRKSANGKLGPERGRRRRIPRRIRGPVEESQKGAIARGVGRSDRQDRRGGDGAGARPVRGGRGRCRGDRADEPKTGLFGRVRGEARVRARVRPAGPRPKRDRRRRGGRRTRTARAVAAATTGATAPSASGARPRPRASAATGRSEACRRGGEPPSRWPTGREPEPGRFGRTAIAGAVGRRRRARSATGRRRRGRPGENGPRWAGTARRSARSTEPKETSTWPRE